MTEYRYVTFRQPQSTLIPPESGGAKVSTIDFLGSVPGLAENMDGWEVVNSQVVPIGEEILLVLLLKMDLRVDVQIE